MSIICRFEVDNKGPILSVVDTVTILNTMVLTYSSILNHQTRLSPLPDDLRGVVHKTLN